MVMTIDSTCQFAFSYSKLRMLTLDRPSLLARLSYNLPAMQGCGVLSLIAFSIN